MNTPEFEHPQLNTPDYDEIKTIIRQAPLTWLPGILVEVAKECKRRRVFKILIHEFIEQWERGYKE